MIKKSFFKRYKWAFIIPIALSLIILAFLLFSTWCHKVPPGAPSNCEPYHQVFPATTFIMIFFALYLSLTLISLNVNYVVRRLRE